MECFYGIKRNKLLFVLFLDKIYFIQHCVYLRCVKLAMTWPNLKK